MLGTWSMSEFGFSQMGKVSNNSVSFLLNFCSWLCGKKILYLENSLNMEKIVLPLLQF